MPQHNICNSLAVHTNYWSAVYPPMVDQFYPPVASMIATVCFYQTGWQCKVVNMRAVWVSMVNKISLLS